MTKISATPNQLWVAYDQHQKVGAGETNSHKLLRVYAAECGLKALLLKRNNLPSTEHFERNGGILDHDLLDLIRRCDIPNLDGAIPKGNGPHIKDLLQYLRYNTTTGTSRKYLNEQVLFVDKIIGKLKDKKGV